MMKDMKQANYRLCDGWKKIPAIIVKTKLQQAIEEAELSERTSMREQRLLDKIDVGTDFRTFLKRGGHYSFRVKKFV